MRVLIVLFATAHGSLASAQSTAWHSPRNAQPTDPDDLGDQPLTQEEIDALDLETPPEQAPEEADAIATDGAEHEIEPEVEPGTPAAAAEDQGVDDEGDWVFDIDPSAILVGGFYYDHRPPRLGTDERNDRFTTLALSRVGFKATYGPYLELESEIEINAGPYGTSVWEGQAALQIRNQLVRVKYEDFAVEVGRITDPASLDYFPGYVANTLLTDPFARFPLLVAGFNRGNGVRASYSPIDEVTLGFTVNAGNPTSTTGTVMVGGSFPPFERFYQVPWADVGRDARGFPTESFQSVIVAPSVMLETEHVRAQAAFQYFFVDTNTNTSSDESITGYNMRAGVQGRFLDDRLRPFVNFSRVVNDTVDEMDLARLSGEYYMGITASGGVDFDIYERSGVGVQYSVVYEDGRQDSARIMHHFVNLGGSWWFLPYASLDARYGLMVRCEAERTGEGFDCTPEGRDEEHVFYLTMKALLGDTGSSGERP